MTSYHFQHFELAPARRQVLINGEPVPLGGRAFDLLLLLVEQRDRVVGKDELLAKVWPGQVVEENNLTVQIAALRKVIGADAIATVAGRGYRFTAPQAPDQATKRVASGDAPEPAPLTLPNLPSIAVLPFENLSGDPSQDYFADGMVEDIITALARMKAFFVIARNSSFVYKGRAVDIKAVGRELGVRYVLEGSVRRAGGRLRITGQLIDALSGQHVWADRFDGAADDIFELQDQITQAIVGALEPSIRRAEFDRTRVLPTSNMHAYDLVWRALSKTRHNTTRADSDEALALVARAVELDPSFALAKALGATACMVRVAEGYADLGDVKTGLRYAEQALAENTDDPVVLSQAGVALGTLGLRALGVRVMGFHYDEAARALERALALSPSLIVAQHSAAYLGLAMCDADATITHWQRCTRLSPLDPYTVMFEVGIGAGHMVAGRYEEALAAAEKGLRESPNYASGHRLKVACLGFLGRLDEARVAARRMMELIPTFTVFKYRSVAPYANADFRKRSAAIYRAAGVPRS